MVGHCNEYDGAFGGKLSRRAHAVPRGHLTAASSSIQHKNPQNRPRSHYQFVENVSSPRRGVARGCADYGAKDAKPGSRILKPEKSAICCCCPGRNKIIAPVRRREHTLSMFSKTPPHPACVGMTDSDGFRTFSTNCCWPRRVCACARPAHKGLEARHEHLLLQACVRLGTKAATRMPLTDRVGDCSTGASLPGI